MIPTKLKLARLLNGILDLVDLVTFQRWTQDDLVVIPDDGAGETGEFYRSPDGRWFVVTDDLCFEAEPIKLFRKFSDAIWEIPPELFADISAMLKAPQGPPASEGQPPIKLSGPDRPIEVVNLHLPAPGKTRFLIHKVLVDAYPAGLTEDELKDRSGKEGAVSMLKKIKKSHPAYNRIYSCPGRRGRGGYRVGWPGEWRT